MDRSLLHAAGYADEIRRAKELEAKARKFLSDLCRQLNGTGTSDREIAEITGFSRARIQQLRTDNG